MIGCIYKLFTATFVFQAGLLNVIIKDFQWLLWACPLNLMFMLWTRIMTIMHMYTGAKAVTIWDDGMFYTVYVLHKISYMLYYFNCITTTFRLGKDIYYKPDPWRVRHSRV